MPDTWRVEVRSGLVCAIERAAPPAGSAVTRTPLEVASQLAGNFRRDGRIDGSYFFEDAMHARTFAELCCEFTAALVERRLAAVRALPAGQPEYRAEDAAGPPTRGD